MKRQDSVGKLVSSLAGHDKDKIYLIIREEGDCFWLADGRIRCLDKPKKKKKKHVQLIKYYTDPNQKESFPEEGELSDQKIRSLISRYERIRGEVE